MPSKGGPMSRTSMKLRTSNLETVAFILIYQITGHAGKLFTRIQFMSSQNMKMANDWLVKLNHKKEPEHLEESLQGTLQNLRDKGFIIFHGAGNYELTRTGVNENIHINYEINFWNINEQIEKIKSKDKEEIIDKAAELFKGMSTEQIRSALNMIGLQIPNTLNK